MNTLQDRGLFTSRKRRSSQIDRFNEAAKRPYVPSKTRQSDVSSLKGKPLEQRLPTPNSRYQTSQIRFAGAVAPSSTGSSHVQEAIHKEVEYKRAGGKGVPENTMKVFRFVTRTFVIPDDFERNHKFGPLSGVTHELRVVSAYTAGQLQARSKEDACVKMCFECGKSGHFPRQCPSLLLE